MTLAELLRRFDTEKIMLVEIDREGGSPFYLADTAYFSEPADVPANAPYYPVIADGGVPRLSRRIQEVWGGRSVPTWGPLTLATNMINDVDLASADIRGKSLRVLLTGKRSQIALADAAVVLDGVVGVRSGNPDEGVTIEVLDRQALFNDIQVPVNVYDGTESVSFPASNIGRVKPLCFGRCRNITPVLIDSANLVYQVNDGLISDVIAVYDKGVALTEVAGVPGAGQYSQDLAAGTFRLGGLPAGEVTADVDGVVETATFLASTTQIIDYLARTYGAIDAGDIDISGLPGDIVGYYINESTTIAEVITALMRGVLGWWGFTRTNTLRARLFSAPSPGGEIFDETRQLSDVKWQEESDVIWSVPSLYRRNWTQISQPAGAVTLDYGAWLNSDGYESRTESAGILAAYPWAVIADRVETYFDDAAAAATVAGRALTLFGVPRIRTRVDVPFVDPPVELGDSVEFADAGRVDGDHLVVGMADRWDGEIPLIEMEVWG